MESQRISKRVLSLKDSVTLKLNEKVSQMIEESKKVYNLTAGQLPFRPSESIETSILSELNFIKSYQYTSVAGIKELRTKFRCYIEKKRMINFEDVGHFDCIISNGAKQAIYNALGALINPDDEVILLAPFWISYPEMIRLWEGKSVIVKSDTHKGFLPSLDDLKNKITNKTKAIIVNSPNNPSGVHYPRDWMESFAKLLEEYPDIFVISDEIYYDLSYFDPSPSYFYQFNNELLKRTIIIDGISKSFALTGLRVGYSIGPKDILDGMTKLQGQTTSGANSLIQRALIQTDFSEVENYLRPIKIHLRGNAQIIKDVFDEYNLSIAWYQSLSAFYFLIDFQKTPLFSNYRKKESDEDYSVKICEDLLENRGVAIVPGADFGVPNTGRISLVIEEAYFRESIQRIASFLTNR